VIIVNSCSFLHLGVDNIANKRIMGVYKDKGVNMKNVRLEMKVKKAQTIASLPFEYNANDTTLRGSATPNHTVGMARAKRLALKGVASVSQPNLYRLRGGK
jgi:hypothetical protein